jgi:hypothetical protein
MGVVREGDILELMSDIAAPASIQYFSARKGFVTCTLPAGLCFTVTTPCQDSPCVLAVPIDYLHFLTYFVEDDVVMDDDFMSVYFQFPLDTIADRFDVIFRNSIKK